MRERWLKLLIGNRQKFRAKKTDKLRIKAGLRTFNIGGEAAGRWRPQWQYFCLFLRHFLKQNCKGRETQGKMQEGAVEAECGGLGHSQPCCLWTNSSWTNVTALWCLLAGCLLGPAGRLTSVFSEHHRHQHRSYIAWQASMLSLAGFSPRTHRRHLTLCGFVCDCGSEYVYGTVRI